MPEQILEWIEKRQDSLWIHVFKRGVRMKIYNILLFIAVLIFMISVILIIKHKNILAEKTYFLFIIIFCFSIITKRFRNNP